MSSPAGGYGQTSTQASWFRISSTKLVGGISSVTLSSLDVILTDSAGTITTITYSTTDQAYSKFMQINQMLDDKVGVIDIS
jgi:hypothetical protein